MESKIIVYTSNGCPYCKQVGEFLEDNHAEFEERNISENKEFFQEWKAINAMGTPLTCFGEIQVLGCNKKKLMEMIKVLKKKQI
ncbi:glutaredoxin family protein [Salipaludibacillus sp. CUR1]|uniref:glutaredoxin family protein n=1 Tax=Salipaludibacillus sp. CUR1 TaxID=2820003 RepID=UPI001E5BB59C|nr:glutaredoxin family protein [Salipaludibacillus sp. CUR1]